MGIELTNYGEAWHLNPTPFTGHNHGSDHGVQTIFIGAWTSVYQKVDFKLANLSDIYIHKKSSQVEKRGSTSPVSGRVPA